MLIGDSRVSHLVVRRREFTRCALKEEARRVARVGFDHVPHRADEVRGDELVVPRERGGVAGVVHKRGEDGAIGIAGYTAAFTDHVVLYQAGSTAIISCCHGLDYLRFRCSPRSCSGGNFSNYYRKPILLHMQSTDGDG